MLNQELMSKLLEEKTWNGVEGVTLDNCPEVGAGEFKGLSISFKEGDVLEFPDEKTIKVFVKETKSGTKVLYVGLIRNGERINYVPVAMFRRRPAASWEKYQEEEDTFFNPETNPLGFELASNGVCTNDLDRVRLLARAGKVLVGKEFKVHCQKFKDGKPIDSWYEQRSWTYSVLEK